MSEKEQQIELCKKLKEFVPIMEKFMTTVFNKKYKTIADLQETLNWFRKNAKRLGFLPTLEEELRYDNIDKEKFEIFLKNNLKDLWVC